MPITNPYVRIGREIPRYRNTSKANVRLSLEYNSLFPFNGPHRLHLQYSHHSLWSFNNLLTEQSQNTTRYVGPMITPLLISTHSKSSCKRMISLSQFNSCGRRHRSISISWVIFQCQAVGIRCKWGILREI